MSLRQDSLVNRFPLPGKDLEKTTTGICGLKPSESFAKFDPDSACWRTSQGSLFTPTLEPYSGTWPRAGISSNGLAWEQTTLERTIHEKDFLLLPTITKFDATCGDLMGKEYSGENRHAMKLIQAIKKLPTPTRREWQDRCRATVQAKLWDRTGKDKHGDGLSRMLCSTILKNGGLQDDPVVTLNPPFAELMMGWPMGWTDLKPLETAKFQRWLKQFGD